MRKSSPSQTNSLAIALRNAITWEQAIYRCCRTRTGEDFNDGWGTVAGGDEVEGKVLMCTFPGLSRIILGKDRKETHVSFSQIGAELQARVKEEQIKETKRSAEKGENEKRAS